MNGQHFPNAGEATQALPGGQDSNGNNGAALVSIGEHTIDTVAGRILCIADIRGKISRLNELAERHQAKAIIHTGDFGFYDKDSIERVSDRTLRHVVQYSSLIDQVTREKYFPVVANAKDASKTPLSLGQLREALLNPSPEQVQDQHGQDFILSEFPKLVRGEIVLRVPVYTVWGACEDVQILEKIRLATDPVSTSPQRTGPSKSEYAIPNLTVLSEGVTRVLNIGGVRLRLFGLGGSLVYHKLFDNGEGNATIAGGNGTMWTTALQIGELIDTAQRVYDPSESRILITHASVGREGLLAQLATAVKADFTVSASLHFRYATSYNDFATHYNTESFRNKFLASNRSFMEVYDSVKQQVDSVIDDQQKKLLAKALGVVNRMPPESGEDPAWKNSWHWNLPDALYGSLVLDIRDGRVGSEMKSTGFNFAYRLSANTSNKPGAIGQGSPHHGAHAGQAGPSRKPQQVPFQQRNVISGLQSAPQQMQPAPAQGYLGRSEDAGSAPRASKPANAVGSPTALNKGPPTPKDFENLATEVFQKKPAAHMGPHVGTAPGPGAGRGRGSAPLKDYVASEHRKNQSSYVSTGPADRVASTHLEEEQKREDTVAASEPKQIDSVGNSDPETKANNGHMMPGAKRGSFASRPPRPPRDDSANWRDRVDEGKTQSQSEASGTESPAGTGSSFRGGRGRARGSFPPGGRGRGDFPGRGDFAGRGAQRPDVRPDGDNQGPKRGGFDGPRGRGRGGHRGGAGSSAEGKPASPANPAPEKPKVNMPEANA